MEKGGTKAFYTISSILADKGKATRSVVEPIVLKSLQEQYARRAREFSDSVALLGRHNSVGPEVFKLFKKIKRQRELCADAEEKLERYIQEEIVDSEVAAVAQR